MPVLFAMQIEVTAEFGEPIAVDLTHEGRLPGLLQLMPQGLAWDLEPGSRLERLLRAFARVLGRWDTWLRAALRQLSPWTAEAELGRWERLLQSNPAKGASLGERRQQAGVLLRARGGQSRTYWRQLLEGMGYQDVEVLALGDPFRCGDRLGRRLQSPQWMFVLLIRAQSIPTLDPIAERLVRGGVRASVCVHFEWK